MRLKGTIHFLPNNLVIFISQCLAGNIVYYDLQYVYTSPLFVFLRKKHSPGAVLVKRKLNRKRLLHALVLTLTLFLPQEEPATHAGSNFAAIANEIRSTVFAYKDFKRVITVCCTYLVSNKFLCSPTYRIE